MNRNLSRTLAAYSAVSLLPALAQEPQNFVPASLFAVPDGLEVSLWASSPMLNNPTNIDVDQHGRIWVAEGVNYRKHAGRRAEGDRIMVLEDKDNDGKADSSHVFVQEKFLAAPLGVAVLDNQVVVSMTPSMIIYTDVDRDLRFDPAVDKREVLLTGFNNPQHDHTLHSVTAGPDGQWYWNAGNCGGEFTDRSGRTFRISGAYQRQSYSGTASDDGHVYVGGFTARMNPDGSDVQIIGHNYRNSFEQTITSFGDVFQSDNDDPPASRVSFVPEFGNAGFSSFDGTRSWQADRRPGQDIPTAEWRQDDPGTMPSGDVYGGGSPTGVAYYENGALGEQFSGMLLACEAARNVVFGYHPENQGAGFKLDRFDFVTTNVDKNFAGSDFLGGGGSVTHEQKTLFRPSDVVVGADGAIYVSDWYDGRVGGHQDLDDSLSGAIYRIAPKGFEPKVPEFDLGTVAGQVTALASPAVNVRNLGFTRLKGAGAGSVPAVAKLLGDADPYIQARAVWLLAQLGEEGIAKVEPLLASGDARMRTVAFRALRRVADDASAVAALARSVASDASAAVRREAALAMRDIEADLAVPVLVALAGSFDGEDRAYLDAIGTGATGKESEVYAALLAEIGSTDPLKWSEAFAWIAWRLHVPAAVPALKERALAIGQLSGDARRLAIDSLAFISTEGAASAMLEVAANAEDTLRDQQMWWLFNRNNNDWRDFGVLAKMEEQGIYDPEAQEIVAITVPDPSEGDTSSVPSVDEVLALEGEVARGKLAAARCLMCHEIEGTGIDYGPALTDWGRTQTREVIVASILEPSKDIAHGFDGHVVKLTDGTEIHGLLIADGDPLMVKSTGGLTQTIPKKRVKNKWKLNRSLMLAPHQQGLTAQDVADITAYLKTTGGGPVAGN